MPEIKATLIASQTYKVSPDHVLIVRANDNPNEQCHTHAEFQAQYKKEAQQVFEFLDNTFCGITMLNLKQLFAER